MAFEEVEQGTRKNLRDVLLEVETVSPTEVTGHDVRTGEAHTVSLATPQEAAKFFSNDRDGSTFDEKVASFERRYEKRPLLDNDGRTQEGSFLLLENTRTFPDGDGSKTAAAWFEAVVRDPKKESVLTGEASARVGGNGRPFVNVLDTDNAKPLQEADIAAAFDGDYQGVPLNQTGAAVIVRDSNDRSHSSAIMTDFRSKAEPSVDSALDKTLNKFDYLAAAVVAAATDRNFDDLKFGNDVRDGDIGNAKAVYDDIQAGGGEFEVMVVPQGSASFLPKDSTRNFMKAYNGTPDGAANPDVTPNARDSYRGKGMADSMLALSAHPSDPDAPHSLRKLIPSNKFEFADQPNRTLPMVMEERMVEVMGASFGNAEPPQQDQSRNMSADASPMG